MDETKRKLLAAQNIEEVAQILGDAGDDESRAEKVWQEACRMREQDGADLSLDELDAVAGGYRDWFKEGCAATVEPGSDCWGEDGGCTWLNINYLDKVCNVPCHLCGAKYTVEYTHATDISGGSASHFACRECGKKSYFNTRTNQWEEYIW